MKLTPEASQSGLTDMEKGIFLKLHRLLLLLVSSQKELA